MKTFTTLAAAAALIAGMSIASAQNAGGPAPAGASPSNINKGSDTGATKGAQSGAESSKTAAQPGAMGKDKKVVGKGKFCIEMSAGGGLECKFTSLAACEKDGKSTNRACSANPNLGTTGSKH